MPITLKKEGIFFKTVQCAFTGNSFATLHPGWDSSMYQKKQKRYHLAVNNRQKHSIRMADILEVSLDYLVGKIDMEIDSSILNRIQDVAKLAEEDKKTGVPGY